MRLVRFPAGHPPGQSHPWGTATVVTNPALPAGLPDAVHVVKAAEMARGPCVLLTVSFSSRLLPCNNPYICTMRAGGRFFLTDSPKLKCSCRPDKVVVHELVIPASLPADLPLRVLQSSSGSRPYATKHRPRLLHLDIDTTTAPLQRSFD